MTTVAQQPISRGRRIWRGLVSHKPLKRHIDWWLRGLAICSVPLIVGCTIIIGAELAAADWFSTGIGLLVANATEDLLNAAIEGSMLGCIALSKQARKAGDKKQASTMKWMGLLFAALTVVTVGFRVFHASADWGLVLLWVRCGAGIVFCCLSHFNDDDEAEEITPQQHRTQMEQLTETFNQQVQQLTNTFAQQIGQVTADLSKLQTSVQNQLTENSAKGLNDFQMKGIEDAFQRLIERHSASLKPVEEFSIESIQAIVTETHLAFQSAFTERLTEIQNTLSVMPTLKAQVAQIESTQQFTQRALKEAMKQPEQAHKAPLKMIRREPVKEVSSTEIDKKAFVIECLTENSALTTGDIQRRATERGFSVSVGTISAARKDFTESKDEGTETLTENTTIAQIETVIESLTENSAVGERVS